MQNTIIPIQHAQCTCEIFRVIGLSGVWGVQELYTKKDSRCRSQATITMTLAEQAIRERGGKYARIVVERDSWMQDWFERMDYVVQSVLDEEYVFMIKNLHYE